MPPSELFALFATFAPEFSGKSTTLFLTSLAPQAFRCGVRRAFNEAAVRCRGRAVGRGFGGANSRVKTREQGRLLRKPIAFSWPVERRPRGRSVYSLRARGRRALAAATTQLLTEE
jgi:hypothetical protein